MDASQYKDYVLSLLFIKYQRQVRWHSFCTHHRSSGCELQGYGCTQRQT
ncbi:hypothetical protein [Methanosarcina horonobensis]|nr:hypothetical protein [Methanosarcina horonobensis]